MRSFEDSVQHVNPVERGSTNHQDREPGNASGRFGGARDTEPHNDRSKGEACTHVGGIPSV